MPRPRIAIIFEFSTLNGGERSMLSVLDELRQGDSRFDWIAIGPPLGRLAQALHDRSIPLVAWSPWDDLGHRMSASDVETSLTTLITALNPDLVHANSLSMGRLLGRIANELTMPTTGHLRDIIKLSRAAIADLNQNQRLVAVSQATRQFHVDQGLDPTRTTVIQNGLDLNRFQPRPRTGWLKSELGLNPSNTHPIAASSEPVNEPTNKQGFEPGFEFGGNSSKTSNPTAVKLIACIGQIGLRKGQDVLAASAPAIVAQFPQTHFLLIGERTSQKEESILFERKIQQEFDQAGLSNRLHWCGNREDVCELLGEIDLLVHPANQEPFGRVLLEASAAGIPIVATDVGGTGEIVIDRVTGRLVPPRDPAALAEAILQLLADANAAQRLGDQARDRALTHFSIAIAAQHLGNFWQEVLAVPTPNPDLA